jgi:hypothetical protein
MLGGQWQFDASRFKLHDFGFQAGQGISAETIICECKEYLLRLLTPIDPTYDCIAFRAGGWCLQPEQELLKKLADAGIKIDSTIFYRGYDKNPLKGFDFRRVPVKPNWWINPIQGINAESNPGPGNILEVGIGSYYHLPRMWFKRVRHRAYRRQQDWGEPPRGYSIDVKGQNVINRLQKKIQHFLFQPIMFDYDSASAPVLMDMVESFLTEYDSDSQEVYLSLIGHPKLLTDAALEQLDIFCARILREKRHQAGFIRFRDIEI